MCRATWLLGVGLELLKDDSERVFCTSRDLLYLFLVLLVTRVRTSNRERGRRHELEESSPVSLSACGIKRQASEHCHTDTMKACPGML